MGVEPMNTGFADQRVSHFATGALVRRATKAAWRATQREDLALSSHFIQLTAVAPSYADTASPSYTQGRSCPRPHWRPRL
jgi:hypothetical protein